MMRLRGISLALAGLGIALFAASLVLKAVWPGPKGTVSLAPGESLDFEGATLVLSDFRVLKYPKGMPRQYESDIDVFAPGEDVPTRATVSVNHPLRWRGWWVYQHSYDAMTERITVLLLNKDPWWPIAALGGFLLLLGAFGLVIVSFGMRPASCGRHKSSRRRIGRLCAQTVLGLAVACVPLVVIMRVVMKPEPVPALQSPMMAPHVAAYATSSLLLILASFGIGRRWMSVGFLLMTVGFVLGAVWGKICWGDFWQYDPKEMWSLATWFVYFGCFVAERRPRVEMVLRFFGAAMIVLTATVANFARLFSGLHSYWN